MTALQEQIQSCCDGRGLSTVRLRRLFTILVQDLFADPDGHGEYKDELQCLRYDVADPNMRDIYIGPTGTKESQGADNSNAVFVSVREMRWRKVAIGNRLGVSADGSKVIYGKEARAHIRLRCLHPDIDMSLTMAESLLTYLEGIRPIFMRYIPGLLDYDVAQMGEAVEDRPAPESRYRVDLEVVVTYQMLIEVAEESHKLKKFGFAVRAS